MSQIRCSSCGTVAFHASAQAGDGCNACKTGVMSGYPDPLPIKIGAETKLVDPQPPPKTAATPAVWSLVMRDMAERDIVGAAKYGVRIQPNNGRDALVDLYQELLDAVVYARQAIYERDGK